MFLVAQDLRKSRLGAGADLWMVELGAAGTETAESVWCCSGTLLCQSPPGDEPSTFTGVLCLWSVFLVLSCEAYLPLGSKSSLKRGRNLVFVFLHGLCYIPANCTTGTKLNRTLNHLSLQEKGFGWINLPKGCLRGIFRYISFWGTSTLLPWLKANTEHHQCEWFLNISFHLQQLMRIGQINLGLKIRW